MRTIIFIVLLCGSLQAVDLTNTSGRVFEHSKITRIVPGGVDIIHAHGAAHVNFSEMSLEDKTAIRNEMIRRLQERQDAIVPSSTVIHFEYEDMVKMMDRQEAKKREERQRQIDHEEYEVATMNYFEELRRTEWERIEKNAVVVLAHYQHPVKRKRHKQEQQDEWSSGCQGYVKNGRSVDTATTFGVPGSSYRLPSPSAMYFDAGDGLKLLVMGDMTR